MDDYPSLEERINQFNAMSLPGQPMGMHMGTSYLVNDLWREVQRLQEQVAILEAELRVAYKLPGAIAAAIPETR